MKKISSWHVGVAAEAFAAAQFARYGIDVSVQYGANQPEYDLIATQGDKMLKISVKGSKDGGWGLTQNYKKGCDYFEAADKWLSNHGKKTIFCLVQFQDVNDDSLPRMYLATPEEIAVELKKSRNGAGDTVLREYHKWNSKSVASGTTDIIPHQWIFTKERAQFMFDTYA
jgi:Holliday junction resolvase-like predicted endonuclease